MEPPFVLRVCVCVCVWVLRRMLAAPAALPCLLQSSQQFRSESIFYSCCPAPFLPRQREYRIPRLHCCIVIFIYLAFCKRNFQWNVVVVVDVDVDGGVVAVVVVGFCVLFDAMSAVFNFNQADPTAAAAAAPWTACLYRPVSSSVVMLLPHPGVCVCVLGNSHKIISLHFPSINCTIYLI